MPGITDIVDDMTPITTDESVEDMTGAEGGVIAVVEDNSSTNDDMTPIGNEEAITTDDDEITEEQAETIVAATSTIYIVAAKMLEKLHILSTEEVTQLVGECSKEPDVA